MAFETLLKIFQIIKNRNFTNIPPNIKLGKEVGIGNDVTLDNFADGALISIGDYSVITNGTKILVHDASSRLRIGMTYVAPVNIGKRVFIGYYSIILPGVSIGDDAIIGAGSVVTKDVEKGTVVAGVPAKIISSTEALDKKRIEMSANVDVFDYLTYDKKHPIDAEKINELVDSARRNGYFFIK